MGLLSQVLGQNQRVQFIQNSSSTVIQLDASLKENHSRKSTLTKFPIENGTSVSDHKILEPFELEITGIITDSPLSGVQQLITEVATTAASALIPPVGVIAATTAGSLLFRAIANAQSPSVAAYLQLLQLQSNAAPFDVITSLYRYPSMWISNLSVPRDAETGKALIFTVSLTQGQLVQPQSVNIQIFSNPGLAANQADLGQQPLNLPSAAQAGYQTQQAQAQSIYQGISQ